MLQTVTELLFVWRVDASRRILAGFRAIDHCVGLLPGKEDDQGVLQVGANLLLIWMDGLQNF